jgi:glycosyltransferase involved in cell wall biosynthesis
VEQQNIWTTALQECEVAVCTVHPPRSNFHCVLFAAKCIQEANLKTHLIQKTGTIVPEYKREFYLPDETIRSSVITISEYTSVNLIDNYQIPKENITLIYQGTDIERFQSQPARQTKARLRYPLPENASPILGCIGSFEDRKGQIELIKAVSKLSAGPLPEIHLLLVGDGSDENKLRAAVKMLNLERQVSFFPFTPEPEYIFERVDITVLPSTYKEGLPNVILESMAMGVPVVSSEIGGIKEVLINRQTGFLVPPGKTEKIAQAILQLWLDQTLYQEIRENALRLIRGNFNKKEQFNHFLSYFNSVGLLQ